MPQEQYGPFKPAPIPGRKPPTPQSFALVDEDVKRFVKNFEKESENLYKDTTGNITVGYGLKIPNENSIREIPLYLYEGKQAIRPATEEEKIDAFRKIKPLPSGQDYPSTWYDPQRGAGGKNLPNLRMQKSDMEFYLERHLPNEALPGVMREMPEFPTYPAPARTVFLDMAYNLGSGAFVRNRKDPRTGEEKGWPKLFGAADKRDWVKASDQAHIVNIPPKEMMKENVICWKRRGSKRNKSDKTKIYRSGLSR